MRDLDSRTMLSYRYSIHKIFLLNKKLYICRKEIIMNKCRITYPNNKEVREYKSRTTNKLDYFSWTRVNVTTVGGSSLYIFDTIQKVESGGYDAAIVYWSKFVIPIEKVVKRLNEKR